MNDRTVWIARIAGIAVLLISLILLFSLRSKLERMTGGRQNPAPAETEQQ